MWVSLTIYTACPKVALSISYVSGVNNFVYNAMQIELKETSVSVITVLPPATNKDQNASGNNHN
jgi:hypothetical protein